MSSSLVKPRSRGASLDRISDAQRIFALEYANCGSPVEAAKKAYPKAKNPSAMGTKTLNHPVVRAYLGKILGDKLKDLDLSAERVLKQLETALFLDPLDLFEPTETQGVYLVRSLEKIPKAVRQCITKMKTRIKRIPGEGGDPIEQVYIEIELMSKDKALELAMKFRDLVRGDRISNTFNVDNSTRIDFDQLCSPPDGSDVVEARIAGRSEVVDG